MTQAQTEQTVGKWSLLPFAIYEGEDRGRTWQTGCTITAKLPEDAGDVAIAQCHFGTRENGGAIARYLVKAANAHDELVAALRNSNSLLRMLLIVTDQPEAVQSQIDENDAALSELEDAV